MYSVVSRSSSWTSPSWGMDSAAIANPSPVMRRKIQQLQCEIRVNCDRLTTSYLDGLFGIHMLDSAQKASSRATDERTGPDPEEIVLASDFWSRMPSYLRSRTHWAENSTRNSENSLDVHSHLHFSRSLLSSAYERLRATSSADSSLEYKLLYLWHGSIVIQVHDNDRVHPRDNSPSMPLFTATLHFLGHNYESQMIWLPVFLHTLLCQKLQAEGTRSLSPHVRLSSKINFFLCSAPIYPVLGESMALRLQVALKKKVCLNWQGLPFISYIHTMKILNQETMVHCLARDQKYFEGYDVDPKEVAQRTVVRWLLLAPGMLIMCLLQSQDFANLEYLVSEGITDDNFSAGLVIGIHRARSHGQNFVLDSLLSMKPSYSALRLVATRNIIDLREDQVIPMFYREVGGILRTDGRSEVHLIRFEPGYQSFTENPLDTFLLKRFRISKGNGTAISYESFSRLAHPNLVTHLGGWSTENELFLVFPSPALTLRDLLQSQRWVYTTEKGRRNILEQLACIGSAIGYLSGLQPVRTGFHNGVRPDNILLFPHEGQEEDLYTWKLGSFGSDSEMFNFMMETKSNTGGNWSRRYAPPKSRHDSNQPSELISGKSDVWSFGCLCVEVSYWLIAQVDSQTLAGHVQMWEPGMSFSRKTYGGEEILQESLVRLLEMIKASGSLHASIKWVAELASQCLSVNQEARITPSTLILDFDALLGTSYSSATRVADHENAAEDDLAPENPLLSPSTVFSEMPLLSSATSMGLDDTALFQEAAPSSLDVQINAIDGWAMAELGLGVEPYVAEEIKQWQIANATKEATQESFAGHEDASMPESINSALSAQTHVTEGVRPSESDQSRNKAFDGLANDLSRNLQLQQLVPEGGKSEPPLKDMDSVVSNSSFAKGIMQWDKLSAQEQEACVGAPIKWNIGSLICLQPVGPLLKLWKNRISSELSAIARDPAVWGKIYVSRRHIYSLRIELVVVRRQSDQQLRPTIVIASAAKRTAQRIALAMRTHQAWKRLQLRFDIIAHTVMLHLF